MANFVPSTVEERWFFVPARRDLSSENNLWELPVPSATEVLAKIYSSCGRFNSTHDKSLFDFVVRTKDFPTLIYFCDAGMISVNLQRRTFDHLLFPALQSLQVDNLRVLVYILEENNGGDCINQEAIDDGLLEVAVTFLRKYPRELDLFLRPPLQGLLLEMVPLMPELLQIFWDHCSEELYKNRKYRVRREHLQRLLSLNDARFLRLNISIFFEGTRTPSWERGQAALEAEGYRQLEKRIEEISS